MWLAHHALNQPAFTNRAALKAAVDRCITESADGRCTMQHGGVPIGDWDVSAVTDMHGMFHGAAAFNQDISMWDVSKVTDMRDMFNGATAFDQDISMWNVAEGTNLARTFRHTILRPPRLPKNSGGMSAFMYLCRWEKRPKIVPYCHNHSDAIRWVRRTTNPLPFPSSAMHVGFFDDSATPNLHGIQLALSNIRARETSVAPVVAHLIFLQGPSSLALNGTFLHVIYDEAGVRRTNGAVKLSNCLIRNMARSASSLGRHYVYKPVLHMLLSSNIEQLIVLDTDTLFVRPLSELWAEFARFSSTAVIGLAPEQNKFYTPIPGKNGGVQLMHLRRMRESRLYNKLLDWHASGESACRTGFMGDQTVYSIIGFQSPLLVHTLPCEWNRQLSPTEPSGSSLYGCEGRCGILHANGITKCAVDLMLKYNSSCAVWKLISRGKTVPSERACMRGNVRFTQMAQLHYAGCCVGAT